MLSRNQQIAKLAANYSLNCYNEVQGVKIERGLTSTTAYVIKDDHFQVVVFRGTQQAHDWLFNLSAIPIKYKGRWCHGGFAMAHKSVWDEIRNLLSPDERTIVCGHSLGGALAELSAHSMNDFIDLHLVTFGKPNVFWKSDVTTMSHLKTQLSFVQGSDIVSRVPRYFYGPDSGQSLVYFSNTNMVCIDPDRDYMKGDWRLTDAVSDHDMSRYKELIDRVYCAINLEAL